MGRTVEAVVAVVAVIEAAVEALAVLQAEATAVWMIIR
jgi:hypothetical protein